jgi:hypothetical protein
VEAVSVKQRPGSSLKKALASGGLVVAALLAAAGFDRTVSPAAGARSVAEAVAVGPAERAVRNIANGAVALDDPKPAAERISTDSLRGRSGKLRARFLTERRVAELPTLARLLGDSLRRPGVYGLAGADFAVVAMLPFAAKERGRIGGYDMGYWPAERGHRVRSPRYANPAGFIRVTPENQDTYVSEHFRLRQFLTKDQPRVWPKYLVLSEDLIDKLELVIRELERGGVPVRHMYVMSGFRTPQYNDEGVGDGGRASLSRHQYGDAADVYVDNDRNGYPDDVNRDGRVDRGDNAVLIAAVERVERAHPDLVGGAGSYRANSAHGPFVHVDVRGYRARW